MTAKPRIPMCWENQKLEKRWEGNAKISFAHVATFIMVAQKLAFVILINFTKFDHKAKKMRSERLIDINPPQALKF